MLLLTTLLMSRACVPLFCKIVAIGAHVADLCQLPLTIRLSYKHKLAAPDTILRIGRFRSQTSELIDSLQKSIYSLGSSAAQSKRRDGLLVSDERFVADMKTRIVNIERLIGQPSHPLDEAEDCHTTVQGELSSYLRHL